MMKIPFEESAANYSKLSVPTQYELVLNSRSGHQRRQTDDRFLRERLSVMRVQERERGDLRLFTDSVVAMSVVGVKLAEDRLFVKGATICRDATEPALHRQSFPRLWCSNVLHIPVRKTEEIAYRESHFFYFFHFSLPLLPPRM